MREDLLPRWDIFEEHLDEATFLWTRREQCLVSPLFDLRETGEEEARLVAHLDALAEAGGVVTRKLAEPALQEDEPARVSAATYVLLSERGQDAAGLLLKALEEGDSARHLAIQGALELWDEPGWAERLAPLSASPLPALKALALEVAAFHGELLDAGTLTSLAANGEVAVRVSALRSARLLPEEARAALVRAALASPEPSVRLAGIELGLLGGMRAAWSACQELAGVHCPERARAWVLLALGGGEKALEVVLRRLEEKASRRQALWALGFSGQVAAADACIEWMAEDPPTSLLAAEAFCAITGLRLEGSYVGISPEAQELPPFEEDDLQADLTPKPEQALPVPAADAIAAWWRSARKQFDPQKRYLYGEPFDGRVLLEALAHTPMRRRHVLALELALRSGGALRVRTRGRVSRQYQELKEASGARQRISSQPFDTLMSR
ncbi:TIGR02270 family protein [Myxococcus sp. Y35]|uniref:TIGR02270 family protein n=1 Tax=Pseudomyxococcus flavus TaxID=3115648 RepID=UPI003CF14520